MDVISHIPEALTLDDTAAVILSYLSDEIIEKLFIVGLIPRLTSILTKQQFWHARIETFSRFRVAFAVNVDWRETYDIIKSCNLYNDRDNVIAVDILYRMGIRPSLHVLGKAARYGQAKIVSYLLLERSIHPDTPISISEREYGEPLALAIKGGHTAVVSLLLADSRVNPTNGGSYNYILSDVCLLRKHDILRLLIKDGRTSDADYRRAMSDVAMRDDDVETVRVLLSCVRPDDTNLCVAAYHNRARIVAALLEDGRADPCCDDNRILRSVVDCGYVDVLKLLMMDGRVDFSVRNNEALEVALRPDRDRIEIANLLLKDERVRELFYNSWLSDRADVKARVTVQPRKS